MLFLSNKKLIIGIKNQDPNTLAYLYRKLFPRVRKMIKKYGGGYDVANDIFQEAIILFYRKLENKAFKKRPILENYLIGVCKLIWKNEYRDETSKFVDIPIDYDEIDETEEVIVREYLQSRRKKMFQQHFNQLQDECKKILKAYFKGKSFLDIANDLDLISEEYARRRKYLCKEYLVKSIKSDPQYSKLIGEYDEEPFVE